MSSCKYLTAISEPELLNMSGRMALNDEIFSCWVCSVLAVDEYFLAG